MQSQNDLNIANSIAVLVGLFDEKSPLDVRQPALGLVSHPVDICFLVHMQNSCNMGLYMVVLQDL